MTIWKGRGGVNGDNTFFDLLAEKWKLEERPQRLCRIELRFVSMFGYAKDALVRTH